MAGSTKTALGKGASLGYSTASGAGPYTYTPLTKVVSINPSLSLGEVEDTTLDTDFGAYLPSIPEGECTFTIRHRPGDPGVKEIQALILAPAIVHWQILYPDGSSEVWDGFIKGYSKTFENKTIVDAECPMRMVTAPAYAEYTPPPG